MNRSRTRLVPVFEFDVEDWRKRIRRARLKRVLTFGFSRGFTSEDVALAERFLGQVREAVEASRGDTVLGLSDPRYWGLKYDASLFYVAVRRGQCWFDASYHAGRIEGELERYFRGVTGARA